MINEVAPYLLFDGRCAEAFRFYERVLGGKIEAISTYADSPMAEQTPPEFADRVVHARMTIGNTVVMGSDAPKDRYAKPQGYSLSIGLRDAAEGERIFAALAEGGTVGMPFGKTFWSPGFGMLTDRFGTPWMVNVAEA